MGNDIRFFFNSGPLRSHVLPGPPSGLNCTAFSVSAQQCPKLKPPPRTPPDGKSQSRPHASSLHHHFPHARGSPENSNTNQHNRPKLTARTTNKMWTPLLPLFLSLLTASYVSATSLTYKLTPSEKACFFATVEEKGAKVAFYFAVGFLFFLYVHGRAQRIGLGGYVGNI